MSNQWNSPGSAAWSSTSSWRGAVPDAVGAKANFLNFATAATTVTLDSSRTVGALNFDSPYGYSLVPAGSSVLTLSQSGAAGTPYSGSATIAVTNVFGNGAHTIAVPLVLAGPLVVTQNSSAPLSITSPISDNGMGYGLMLAGTGTTVLSGGNTYSGGTTVTSGGLTLDFSQSGAPASNILPAAGPLALGGSSLNLVGGAPSGSGGASVQNIGALTLNGGGNGIALNANGGTSLSLAATGAFTVNGAATLTVASGTNTSFSIGSTWIHGSGDTLWINLASGTLTSSPTCAVNGLIGGWVTVSDVNGLGLGVVSGGNIVSSAGGPLLPSSGADSTVNYTLGGGTSSQTVTASQAANSLTITPAAAGQGLTINAGQTLGLTANALLFNGANFAFSVSGPGQLGSGDSALTLYAAGSNALTIAAPLGSGSGSLTILGPGTVVLTASSSYSGPTMLFAGATLQLGDGAGSNGAVAGDVIANGNLVFANVAAQTYSGAISGAGSVTKFGPAALTLSGSNTYSGGTWLRDGTLQLAGNAALGPGGLTVNAGVLDMAGYSPTVLSLRGSAGVITNGGSLAATLTVNQSTATTFFGALQDGPGGLGLVMTGSSSLTLAGSNAYSGGTYVRAGTIALGAQNSLPATGTLTLGGAGTSGAFDLAGFNQQLGGLAVGNGATASMQIIGDSSTVSGSTLTISSSGSSSFAGVIRDSLGGGNQTVSLALAAGQLTLSGSNTYSGGTTISGGTLQIGSLGNQNDGGSGEFLASQSISLSNSASLVFCLSDALAYGGLISGSGNLTKMGKGILTLKGANTYTGNTTLIAGNSNYGELSISASNNISPFTSQVVFKSGILQITGTALTSLGNDPVNWSTFNGGFDIAAAADVFTLSAPIGGGGFLARSGPGTLVLTASNTYGPTLVVAGTLEVSGTGTLGTGQTMDQSMLLFALSGASTYGGFIWNNGGLTQAGTGTLTLSNSNAYTGGTTISAGTLQVGNGGRGASIGSTSGVLDNASLVFNHSDAATFAPVISGSGSLTQTGTGVLTLLGSNTYSGGTTIANGTIALGTHNSLPIAGTLVLGGSGTSGTFDLAGFNQQVGGLAVGSGAVAAGQIIGNSSTVSASTLTFSGTASSNFAGTIEDSLGSRNKTVSLVVAGGQLTLSGSATYSGPTAITAGILQAGAANALSPNSDFSISGGTLDASGFAQTLNSLTVGPWGR